MKKYAEYKKFDLAEIAQKTGEFWEANDVFEKSVSSREGRPEFVFYEGPPSANGLPGIHHVMARTIKDIFCRFKTLKGFQVRRKAGWDTHGLPIELSVEKELGITKEDIGKKISIEDYNRRCREAVMKYTSEWSDLTTKMGYWVDMDHPYITYENKYIESVWYLLKKLHDDSLLYKGYTIQPYSPKAGTGLSTHELNQPRAHTRWSRIRPSLPSSSWSATPWGKNSWPTAKVTHTSWPGRPHPGRFLPTVPWPWEKRSNTSR